MQLYASRYEAFGDGRLATPVFERNGAPILAALAPLLADGTVLELGSGTGQHGCAVERALPGIAWQASDPDPAHRGSSDAWRAHFGLAPRPAREIDAARDWAGTVADLGPLAAVVSMNVIHISPIAVLDGILSGAAEVLRPGGLCLFYGPFQEGGAHTGDGNARFDASLRAQDPRWGVRDVDDILARAAPLGLARAGLHPMPANNRLLVLRRRGRSSDMWSHPQKSS